jgi:RNA polymerase sigma-70 factor (ECF subfamily)
MFSNLHPFARPVLVDGLPGVVVAPDGQPLSVMWFTVVDDRVVAIDVLADPDRLAALELPDLS